MGQWEKKTRQIEQSIKAEGFNIKLYNLSVSEIGLLSNFIIVFLMLILFVLSGCSDNESVSSPVKKPFNVAGNVTETDLSTTNASRSLNKTAENAGLEVIVHDNGKFIANGITNNNGFSEVDIKNEGSFDVTIKKDGYVTSKADDIHFDKATAVFEVNRTYLNYSVKSVVNMEGVKVSVLNQNGITTIASGT